MTEPAYIGSYRSGRLERRRAALTARLAACDLCPRCCRVNRSGRSGPVETGFCRTGPRPIVSSFGLHFGEEAPLVGRGGSGTIFFTNCNLGCRFCQNYDISLLGRGEEISPADLAAMMINLQAQGAHNINLVTPTHQVAAIVAALPLAIEAGLNIPLVYNCGGYESVDTLKHLDGLVDIYMPDFKFADPRTAERLCGAADYFDRAKEAVVEMHRQVGDLRINDDGLAVRGLLVRHLVLPGGLAGSREVFRFLAGLSRKTYLNVMAQYHPAGEAGQLDGLDRRITAEEHARALTEAALAGLTRLDAPGPWRPSP